MHVWNRAQAKTASYNKLPEMSWGSQIRSYTLQPYQLIKDVRTGYEVGTGGVQAVLDGDLDGWVPLSADIAFINTHLINEDSWKLALNISEPSHDRTFSLSGKQLD